MATIEAPRTFRPHLTCLLGSVMVAFLVLVSTAKAQYETGELKEKPSDADYKDETAREYFNPLLAGVLGFAMALAMVWVCRGVLAGR